MWPENHKVDTGWVSAASALGIEVAGCLKYPWAKGILVYGLGRTDHQTPDAKLVQLAVGPPECRLPHIVKMRDIKFVGQRQRASDRWIDAYDPSFQAIDTGGGMPGPCL